MSDSTKEQIHHSQSGDTTRTITREDHQISIPIAIFSVVSVTIGAGMVAVPKASFNAGIPWAIGYNIFNFIMCVYSIHLYLEWGRIKNIYSIPHLGYEWFGHCSLYFVNFVQFLGFGLLPIAYYIIFAGLSSSLLKEIPGVKENEDHFLRSQWFSVLVLAVIIFPLIIKKKIQELKVAGILLFSGVSIFIILMLVLKIDNGDKLTYKPEDSKHFYKFEFGKAFLSSLSTAFVAYGFQSAFFPIYNSLKIKSYYNGMKFTYLGIGFWFWIYIGVMFLSLYSFGVHIEGDVLHNVSEISTWESYVLRAIFLLVMSTHTPFIFFIGKESLLALFALIYLKTKGSKMESFHFQDNNDYKPLVETKATKNQSMDQRRVKNKIIGASEKMVSSSVDFNISMALPFYTKSLKTMVVSNADTGLTGAAHEILPSSWYYVITITLYAMVVAAAWLIEDVEIVIKFIGSMANATLNFTLPGLYYFIISRREKALKPGEGWKAYLALALAMYGFVMGFVWTGINVWTTISPVSKYEPDDFMHTFEQ